MEHRYRGDAVVCRPDVLPAISQLKGSWDGHRTPEPWRSPPRGGHWTLRRAMSTCSRQSFDPAVRCETCHTASHLEAKTKTALMASTSMAGQHGAPGPEPPLIETDKGAVQHRRSGRSLNSQDRNVLRDCTLASRPTPNGVEITDCRDRCCKAAVKLIQDARQSRVYLIVGGEKAASIS